jgi:hypothetical protein
MVSKDFHLFFLVNNFSKDPILSGSSAVQLTASILPNAPRNILTFLKIGAIKIEYENIKFGNKEI